MYSRRNPTGLWARRTERLKVEEEEAEAEAAKRQVAPQSRTEEIKLLTLTLPRPRPRSRLLLLLLRLLLLLTNRKASHFEFAINKFHRQTCLSDFIGFAPIELCLMLEMLA